jgi:surface polysaccharide O-acyltransferase-like enzyme
MNRNIVGSLESSKAMTERDARFDFLRVSALMFVLIIHSANNYAVSDAEKIIANWLDTFSRPCIAIFLVVSGYFFRIEELSGGYILTKIKRVLVPYVFFSSLAFLYQYRGGIYSYVVNHPFEVIFRLLTCTTFEIYWFVLVIIFCYLLGFVCLTRGDLHTRIPFLVTVFLILNLLHAAYYSPLADHFYLRETLYGKAYQQHLLLSWPFYFFLGVFISRRKLLPMIESNRRLVISTWAFLFLVYNVLLFTRIGNLAPYSSTMATLYSLSVVSLLFVISYPHKYISALSDISYTIYLSHPFFVYFLRGLGKHANITWPYWFSVVCLLFSLFGSVAVCLMAQKLLKSRSRLLIGC